MSQPAVPLTGAGLALPDGGCALETGSECIHAALQVPPVTLFSVKHGGGGQTTCAQSVWGGLNPICSKVFIRTCYNLFFSC